MRKNLLSDYVWRDVMTMLRTLAVIDDCQQNEGEKR
jgi:hypothetical protein